MIEYSTATTNDIRDIANLHAQSWQIHYKGILEDEYLSNEVVNDRMALWTDRLENQSNNQYLLLARSNGQLLGFACTFLNEDPIWGSFMDNLHVSFDYKGQGIGRELMKRTASHVLNQGNNSKLYLWVLQKNPAAIAFYEKLGGQKRDLALFKNPGGGQSHVYRYYWPDVKVCLDS